MGHIKKPNNGPSYGRSKPLAVRKKFDALRGELALKRNGGQFVFTPMQKFVRVETLVCAIAIASCRGLARQGRLANMLADLWDALWLHERGG